MIWSSTTNEDKKYKWLVIILIALFKEENEFFYLPCCFQKEQFSCIKWSQENEWERIGKGKCETRDRWENERVFFYFFKERER